MKRCSIACLTLLLVGGLAVASCPSFISYPVIRQRAYYGQQHYIAPTYYQPLYRVSIDSDAVKLHELIERQNQLIESLMLNGSGGAALVSGQQVLALKCASCHSAAQHKSGKGTVADNLGNGFVLVEEDGSAVALSKNDARRILVRLTHPDPSKRMPPGASLPPNSIGAVKKHLEETAK